MQELLEHLVRYWSFIWASARYRIVDSMATTRFGGDAVLVVASDDLRMRFVRDRGQLFLDVQPPWATKAGEWYSVDLVDRLLTGERQDSSQLSEHYAELFRTRLSEIEDLFATREAFKVTKTKLDALKKIRAKEMFG